jgi:hypothetical protein
MATALGTLEYARKILIDRVRSDEDHLRRETAGPRELCLFDRRFRRSVVSTANDRAVSMWRCTKRSHSFATARRTWRGIAR